MKSSPIWVAFLSLSLVGCASQSGLADEIPQPAILVHGELKAGSAVEIDAYALYFGELLLYDSQAAAEHRLIYPYCLSANSHELDNEQRRAFDHKWVRVVGTFVEEDQYDDPPNSIRTMGSADGLAFPNQCSSPFMLRIEHMELIKPPANINN